MSNDEFGRFGRRPFGGGGGGDEFDEMRQQMARDRDAFFRDSGAGDWGRDPPQTSRYFTTPRSSFAGFPSGGSGGVRRDFDGLAGGGGGGGLSSAGAGRLPAADHHRTDSSGGSVPINVLHERSGPKQKYSGSGVRNTTELPGAARTNGEHGSPRLERAHSEPPKQFNSRLNLSRPSHYSTIQENFPEPSPSSTSASTHPHLVTSTNNPIKTSASAPSVPEARGGGGATGPVPPPRRSPPRPQAAASGMSSTTGVPTADAANVRHIPIFVEGRPEPIFNANTAAGGAAAEPEPQSPFPKPSDYYPKGVQRIRSRDESDQQQQQQREPLKIPVNANTKEPTTPQGPPPGPIPMGYVPPTPPTEPTTPMGPPPGPIPMGYMPNSPLEPPADTPIPLPCDPQLVSRNSNQAAGEAASGADENASAASTKESQSNAAVNAAAPADASIHAESKKTSESPEEAATQQKQQQQPEPTLQQQNNEPQRKKSQQQEPKVNFIPIRVEHQRPASPAAAATINRPSSRPSSQEIRGGSSGAPSPVPGGGVGGRPSPTPSAAGSDDARAAAAAQSANDPQPPPQPAKDPRVSTLESILAEAEVLGPKVDNFSGSRKDKEYLELDDKLTKLLIKADSVNVDGEAGIRQLRKESCSRVDKLAILLEQKASGAN